jgi:di/tricarboxylate transporter
MGWEAWFILGLLGFVLVALARNWAAPDVVLMGALTLTMGVSGFSAGRLPDAGAAIQGFANEGLITVGVLFVVVAGLTQTGAMALITQPMLGRPRTVLGAQARLMFPLTALSAFLNNTPIVAAFMPVVGDWCKRTGIAPSKLFIPLSYAAILGGTCTLIGTSTNLVVNGLLLADPTTPGLGMFDLAWIGVPCAVVGVTYVLLMSRWLLPDRKSALSLSDDPRRYTVEMVVQAHGPLVGQTIEQAGLRHLPGLFLVEIERAGELLAAVGPSVKLEADDRLVFVGIVESVVDLRKMRGLSPATNQVFKLNAPQDHRCLIEAVVSSACPLVGKSIREGGFRTMYGAAIIAVARGGQRIQKKIGDIILQPGDTLLLESPQDFARRQRNSRDFYLVSKVQDSTPPRHDRAWAALVVLLAMVVLFTAGWVNIVTAAMLAAGAMILLRCCTATVARQSIDWQVLIVIGASFGLGSALDKSGAAATIARNVVQLTSGHPTATLAVVYALTMGFTALINNNAAAVLMFPIAKAAAGSLGADLTPFAVAIMLAASNDFATPLGYQTNLMVYGPGGYRFMDYVRFGGPLNGLMFLTSVTLIPLVWKM